MTPLLLKDAVKLTTKAYRKSSIKDTPMLIESYSWVINSEITPKTKLRLDLAVIFKPPKKCTAKRCNRRVKVLGFARCSWLTRVSLSLSLSPFPFSQILLPMRLLIPVAARSVNSNRRLKKLNGIRRVSSADTKRDVPGRGHWLSKGTTYKYQLVVGPLLLLSRRLVSSSAPSLFGPRSLFR